MKLYRLLPLVLLSVASMAQTQPKPIAYAVSTIKPSPSTATNHSFMFTSAGLRIDNLPIKFVILDAYNLQEDQIANVPDWAKNFNYDIEAKVDDDDRAALVKMPIDERRTMVKPLLAERFKLKTHLETRELPIYALVIAKGGSKLVDAPKIVDEPGKHHNQGIRAGRGELTGMEAGTDGIVRVLGRYIKRPIVDRTGLTGSYNFTLKWTDEDAPADPESNAPSMFTALQEQLGLKLEATKASMTVVVIDSIEQPTPD
jgi:uncharacterized protein (TIGR03435 family)